MCFVAVEAKARFLTASLRTTAPSAHDPHADFVLRCLDFGDTIRSFCNHFSGSVYAGSILLRKTVRANAIKWKSVNLPSLVFLNYCRCRQFPGNVTRIQKYSGTGLVAWQPNDPIDYRGMGEMAHVGYVRPNWEETNE
jgi:hypothetical protein